jgi:flagellar export protein FliJ
MARFQFRLHQVLSYREALLEQTQLALVALERQQAALEAEAERLGRAYRQVLDGLPSIDQPLDIASSMVRQDYLRFLEARLAEVQRAIDAVRARLEPLRIELVERHQQVEMLRKIRQREWERWNESEKHRAAKQIEEIVHTSIPRSATRR